MTALVEALTEAARYPGRQRAVRGRWASTIEVPTGTASAARTVLDARLQRIVSGPDALASTAPRCRRGGAARPPGGHRSRWSKTATPARTGAGPDRTTCSASASGGTSRSWSPSSTACLQSVHVWFGLLHRRGSKGWSVVALRLRVDATLHGDPGHVSMTFAQAVAPPVGRPHREALAVKTDRRRAAGTLGGCQMRCSPGWLLGGSWRPTC